MIDISFEECTVQDTHQNVLSNIDNTVGNIPVTQSMAPMAMSSKNQQALCNSAEHSKYECKELYFSKTNKKKKA